MQPAFVRHYVLLSLESHARTFTFLLRDLGSQAPLWDARPDPERFTLREIVAHLAEFDTVMRERFEHMIREDKPGLPNWDESEAARHYARRDPVHQLALLQESRRELRAWLEGLGAEEWLCTATRPSVGEFSVEDGVSMMIAHDAYHLEQVCDWLRGGGFEAVPGRKSASTWAAPADAA